MRESEQASGTDLHAENTGRERAHQVYWPSVSLFVVRTPAENLKDG